MTHFSQQLLDLAVQFLLVSFSSLGPSRGDPFQLPSALLRVMSGSKPEPDAMTMSAGTRSTSTPGCSRSQRSMESAGMFVPSFVVSAFLAATTSGLPSIASCSTDASMSGPTGWPGCGPRGPYFSTAPNCVSTRSRMPGDSHPSSFPRGGCIVRDCGGSGVKVLVRSERLGDESRSDRMALRIRHQAALGFVMKDRLADAQNRQRIEHRA